MSAPATTSVTYRRSFAGSLAEVAETARWADAIAAQHHLGSDQIYAIQVCFEELLINVVKHGGKADPHIEVAIELAPAGITISIEDDGVPFDVTAAVPRRIETPIEDVMPGGLGIQLVRSFTERLTYCRIGDRNRVAATIATAPVEPSTA